MPQIEKIQIGAEAVEVPIEEYNITAMREAYPLMQAVYSGWLANPQDGTDPLELTLACTPVVAFALRNSRPDLTAKTIEDALLPSQCIPFWTLTTAITRKNGFRSGEAAAPEEPARADQAEQASTETSTL